MRTRAAMIGVVAIGMAAAAAEARAVVRAAAVAQAALAAGVDVQVGSMPSAATPICPGAICPREAKAGC